VHDERGVQKLEGRRDVPESRLEQRSARLGDGAAALGAATRAAAADGKRLRPALLVAGFRAFDGTTPP
jgi:geranylgeranyl pyrophosphate synthase